MIASKTASIASLPKKATRTANSKPSKAATTERAPAVTATVPVKVVAKQAAKKTVLPVKKDIKTEAKPVVKVTLKALSEPAAKPKAEKLVKAKKPKLVRDSFTIPKGEYSVLNDLKQRAGKLAWSVKKSELIRAGVKALASMSDAQFLAALKAVPIIKTGRPSNK